MSSYRTTDQDLVALYGVDKSVNQAREYYKKVLERFTVPFEHRTLLTDYGPTHLLVCGHLSNPPVILLHGSLTNATFWQFQLPVLAGKYQVYALDVIAADDKNQLSEDISRYTGWLVQLLDRLGLEKAHFVGHSEGGWLIVKLAGLAPERLSSAVLLSPLGFASYSFIRLLPLLFETRRDSDNIECRAIAPKSKIDLKTLEEYAREVPAFKGVEQNVVFRDEELDKLTAPTLVLAGKYEVLYSPKKVIQRARQLPSIRQAEIIPAAMFMCLEAPHTVNKHLTKFLDSVATSPL
jgi:pimeloyl-ACP methyl ester carboxylesterase